MKNEGIGVEVMRVNKKRSDCGVRRLVGRDVQALRFVNEMYAVSMRVTGEVLGLYAGRDALAESSTWRPVNRWREMGLVEVGRVLVGDESAWVSLTRKGQKVVESPWDAWVPKPVRMAHVGAVGEVRVQLARELPGLEWVSERQLRSDRAMTGEHRAHVADGVLRDDSGREMFIEVELTPKGAERTGTILADLLGRRTVSGAKPSVSYHVAKPATAGVLGEYHKLSAEQRKRVRVVTLEGEPLSGAGR